jgi:outer membrane protein OmpA-like peptidoglycan-associated protein
MKQSMVRLSAVAAIVIATASISLTAPRAQNAKQLGSQPTYDSLIKSLTPEPSQVGVNSRGLRVLSAKTPGTASAKSSGSAAAEPAQEAKAPAVALDIRFASGSDELTDSARDTIERIGAALKSSQLGTYRFRVEGHTDSKGNPDANQSLSERRAAAVKTYLVEKDGIKPDRLETVGKGSSEPLDAEHPASGVNRRVQIVNLGPS